MGLFNNKKKLQQTPPLAPPSQQQSSLRQPLNAEDVPSNRPTRVRSTASRSTVAPELALDWSKIYVEIDNDANFVGPDGSVGTQSYDDTTTRHTMMTMTEIGTEDSGSTGISQNYSNLHSVGDATSAISVSGELSRNQTSVDDDEETRFPSGGEDEMEKAVASVHPVTSYQPSAATSKDESAANFTITNNGKYLTANDFANAQLMRWKFAAEEGPSYIQILAFLASLATLGSTLYPVITYQSYWTIPILICAYHTTILCCIILVFEFRVMGARNPMNVRARARTLLTRYLNILRLLWGRGCLYIFTGSMNITIDFRPYSLYTGLTLIGLGILAVLVGAHASFNLERLKLSLTDPSFLWSKFEAADSDKDNLIDISEFSNLIWSLGMELDDAYTYRAFSQIDNDSDARINFREFKGWWIAAVEQKGKAPLPEHVNV